MTSARRSRALSVVVLVGLFGFLVLAVLGALAYPGGTYCEPSARVYRFWDNFLCDVTSEITRRGEDNAAGARLTRAAFGSFAVALAPFWWLLGGLGSRGLGTAVRLLGVPSAMAVAVVAWLPSTWSSTVHTTMVLVAAIPGLLAAMLGTVLLLAGPRRGLGWLGVATLAAGALNTAGYVWAVAHLVACLPWLPVVQKLAGIGLVSWMAAVALRPLRGDAE
jgi:hypothetical protein